LLKISSKEIPFENGCLLYSLEKIYIGFRRRGREEAKH
jgi:hypothetical protein